MTGVSDLMTHVNTPMSRITQADIAKALKIARSTVATVLSGMPGTRISSETAERIRATAEKMGYRPNRYAQVMKRGSSGLIGIVHCGTMSHLPRQKVAYAVKEILAAGYEPLLQDISWFKDSGLQACERLLDARVEGVLIVHPTLRFSQAYLDLFLKAGIPAASIGGDWLHGITRFMSDKEQGFHDLTCHLLGLGHRRLVWLGEQDSSHNRWHDSWHRRNGIAGFKRALKSCPEAKRNSRVHLAEIPMVALQPEELQVDPFQPGQQAMAELLATELLPDAVLCSNDERALGALTACAEAGLQIPQELAVTGFENEPIGMAGLLPLTTVAHPTREITTNAVGTLLELVRAKCPPEDRIIKFPMQLIVRRSCGANLFSTGTAPEQAGKSTL